MKLRWTSIPALALAAALVAVACGGAEPTSTPAPTATRPPPTNTVAPTASSPVVVTPTQPAATPTAAPTATPTRPAATATPILPKRGGTLRFMINRDPEALRIHEVRGTAIWASVGPIANWLVQNYQGDNGVKPDLADSWTASSDGLVYTFKLSPNAVWHDGVPINADDVIFSLDRIAFSLASAPYRATLNAIKPGGLEKVDDKTVKVTLKQPSAIFIPALGVMGNVILPKHYDLDNYARINPAVGSGPFKFTQYVPSVKMAYVRNDKYFKKDANGQQLPYLNGVDIFIIPDSSAAYSAYRTGQLDVTFPVQAEILKGRVKQVKDSVAGTTVKIAYAPYRFSISQKAPLADVRVRRALNLAIDREEFNDLAVFAEGTPFILMNYVGGEWSLPDSEIAALPGWRKPKAQDIAQAKQLLETALKDYGLTIATWQPEVLERQQYEVHIVQIAEQWKRNLGLTVKLYTTDQPGAQARENAGNFELTFSGLSGGFLDHPTQTFRQWFYPKEALNYGKWDVPELNKLIDAIDKETDEAKLKDLNRQAELLIQDQVLTIIVGAEPRHQAWRPEVKAFPGQLHSQDGPSWRFEKVWLNK